MSTHHPIPDQQLLQIAQVALSCARMCAWDWDMLANQTVYFGDPVAIFGSDPAADYHQGFRSFLHPDDINHVEQRIEEQAHAGTAYEDEFRIVHRDGSIRWIYARGRFLQDATGRPVHLIGVNVDVTEQKARDRELEHARTAAQEQHHLLDTIVNNIPVMICYMREPGKVHWVNRAWTETLGWAPEENGGDAASLMYPNPADLQRVRDFIVRADGSLGQFRSRTKFGPSIDTQWLNVSLPDGTNIGIGRDVSAQLRSDAELRESERRFRMISDNIPQLVWIADPAGATIYYNQRWYDYTGQTPERAAGFGWLEVMHPDEIEANQVLWDAANREGKDFENEIRVRGRDGEYRWFLVRATPIRDENGVLVNWFGTDTDITDKRAAQEALIRSEKLAMAGRFAATVAHEVNNPLTAVTNIHYMLSLNDSLPEDVRASLQIADNELRRVSHILRQTLAFYREHSRKEPVRPLVLMDEVLAIFGKRLENRGIAFNVRIPGHLSFPGTPGEVRQILCNLVANAVDATSRGGRIHVRARVVSLPDRDRIVRILVADSGCGIPTANMRRVFEPFFTSKQGVGTGLGLWVTKTLVERNGGRILLRSRAGLGTVFVLQFPCGDPPSQITQRIEHAGEAPVLT